MELGVHAGRHRLARHERGADFLDPVGRRRRAHERAHGAMEYAVTDRDRDVGEKVPCAGGIDASDVAPKGWELVLMYRLGEKQIDSGQEDRKILVPPPRQQGDPTESLHDRRQTPNELRQRRRWDGRLARVELDRGLIPVDVVAEVGEPFPFVGGKAHQRERVVEGPMKTLFDEVPRQWRHYVGKSLGGLVAGPARRDRWNRTSLEQSDRRSDASPLDVLRPSEVLLDLRGETSDVDCLVVA